MLYNPKAIKNVVLDGHSLTLESFVAVSRFGATVELAPSALEAMKKADSGDKAAIMAALPSVTYTGVSGSIAFDAQGDAIRDTAYIKAADTASGAWVLETVQTGSGS